MASTKKKCAYVKCECEFYGGKRAIYCTQKCGQYQRRLDNKGTLNSHNEKGESDEIKQGYN